MVGERRPEGAKLLGLQRPCVEGGKVVAEGGVIDLVGKDTEESSGLAVWVWLELRVDLDDECGGDGREQTIPACKPRQHGQTGTSYVTHEDGCCVQVFIVLLEELLVIFLRILAVVFVELSSMVFITRL